MKEMGVAESSKPRCARAAQGTVLTLMGTVYVKPSGAGVVKRASRIWT